MDGISRQAIELAIELANELTLFNEAGGTDWDLEEVMAKAWLAETPDPLTITQMTDDSFLVDVGRRGGAFLRIDI